MGSILSLVIHPCALCGQFTVRVARVHETRFGSHILCLDCAGVIECPVCAGANQIGHQTRPKKAAQNGRPKRPRAWRFLR
jgi:hypothetical protein